MTEWLGVATVASAILLGFVRKAGGKIAQETGKEIFTIVRKKLDKDKDGKALLANFKREPEGYASALADEISRRAKEDEAFGRKMAALVERVSSAGGERSVFQFAQGDGIAQSAGDGAEASVKVAEVPFVKRKRSRTH